MVKQRMTAVDIAAEVACLRNLIGFRCSNVYDLSPKVHALPLHPCCGSPKLWFAHAVGHPWCEQRTG